MSSGAQLSFDHAGSYGLPFRLELLVHADKRSLDRLFAIHGLDVEQRACALAAIEAARAGTYGGDGR